MLAAEGAQLVSCSWLSMSINEIRDVSHFPGLACPGALIREPGAEPHQSRTIITEGKGSCSLEPDQVGKAFLF